MGRWLPWLLGSIFLILIVLALFSETPSAALLSVAAVVTATSGVLSALAAVKKSSKEAQSKAEADCLRRLTRARHRVEKLVAENHELRTR